MNLKVARVAVTKIDDGDITVEFIEDGDGGLDVDKIKDTAEALFAELKALVDAGKLTLVLKNEAEGETFDLEDGNVVVAVAQFLLDGDTAENFKGGVEATYTAEVTYEGVDFDLAGTLKFDIYEEEA